MDNIYLTALDSELWEKLRGAYGNVSKDVGVLMGADGDKEIAFENICENLCHQMSFYNAVYLVMPYMVKLLEQKEEEQDFTGMVSVLSNMGICLATDFPSNHSSDVDGDILMNYQKSVEVLQDITRKFLAEHMEELGQLDENERNMFVTGVLAILGDREAAFVLTLSAWDECFVLCDECEYCDEELVLSDEDINEKITPAKLVLDNWDGKNFDDVLYWFGNLLNMLGADKELEAISYYYGTYTCPDCGNTKIVIDMMKNYFFNG